MHCQSPALSPVPESPQGPAVVEYALPARPRAVYLRDTRSRLPEPEVQACCSLHETLHPRHMPTQDSTHRSGLFRTKSKVRHTDLSSTKFCTNIFPVDALLPTTTTMNPRASITSNGSGSSSSSSTLTYTDAKGCTYPSTTTTKIELHASSGLVEKPGRSCLSAISPAASASKDETYGHAQSGKKPGRKCVPTLDVPISNIYEYVPDFDFSFDNLYVSHARASGNARVGLQYGVAGVCAVM